MATKRRKLLDVLRLIEKVSNYQASDAEKLRMMRYAGSDARNLDGIDVEFWTGEAVNEAIKEFGLESVVKACNGARGDSLGSVELILKQSGLVADRYDEGQKSLW